MSALWQRPLAALLLVISREMARAEQQPKALAQLQDLDLECAACRYVWKKLDEDAVAAQKMKPEKRTKKLRSKWGKSSICKETRFGERMGVAKRAGKYTPRGSGPLIYQHVYTSAKKRLRETSNLHIPVQFPVCRATTLASLHSMTESRDVARIHGSAPLDQYGKTCFAVGESPGLLKQV